MKKKKVKDELVDLTCANCGRIFQRSKLRVEKEAKRTKKNTPCCSKSCSGRYGRKTGATPRFFISPKSESRFT